MAGLNFKYFSGSIAPHRRIAFEAYVNSKYAVICDQMNDSDSYVLVYWTKPHNHIKGIFITDLLTQSVMDTRCLDQFVEQPINGMASMKLSANRLTQANSDYL
jgi:hypothetical protein